MTLPPAAYSCISSRQAVVLPARFQPQPAPKASRASRLSLLQAPVSTTEACSAAASSLPRCSAPLPWPPSSGITQRPRGSSTSTAGSTSFPRINGAISRVTAPMAPTTSSVEPACQCSFSCSEAVPSERLIRSACPLRCNCSSNGWLVAERPRARQAGAGREDGEVRGDSQRWVRAAADDRSHRADPLPILPGWIPVSTPVSLSLASM